MSRVRMPNGQQEKLLNRATRAMNFNLGQMAKICGVDKRTLFDWRREKYQMSYKALKNLHKVLKISAPKNIKILPEYWSIPKAASAGGRVTARLHGGPGTLEGRRKGGINSQRKFRLDPELAKKRGFKLRKKIKKPKKSLLLAEFIGIMLGDGHIDNCQFTVSMNNRVDQEYAQFVNKIIEKIFGIPAAMRVRVNALIIVGSSKNLTDYLISYGLKRGNKIAQQVDVPKWIFENKKFIKVCLRGLIDTDGGIYYHNHTTKGIKYRHIGLCFTSRSLPLLKSVGKMFLAVGINNAKTNKKDRIFLYGKEKVGKYLSLVGTSNPKHLRRYQSYKNSIVIR